jgi:uncharacterized membrane protein YdjX (TVP38/TMEM64 family)
MPPPRPSQTVRILRRVFIGLWLAVIAFCVISYLGNPSEFTPEKIAHFLERFHGWVWLAYIAFSVLRGLTLLPSTPLVIAGTILFPTQPLAVLGVSMLGIVLSSTMIYYFSDLLGFSAYFERHKPETIHRVKARLEHPMGFLFVAAWAFFPLVPTDLVCYLAGVTRMNFAKFIVAVAAGELVLCIFYIFLGGSLIRLMH